MTRTDEELDRDWQPNGRRPRSTIARNFQLELEDIFGLDTAVSELDQKVEERKQNLGKTNKELADLEARIREMEARLSQTGHQPRPLDFKAQQADTATSTKQDGSSLPPPTDGNSIKARSRPGTARATQQAPSSGNMPPTPGGSVDGDGE